MPDCRRETGVYLCQGDADESMHVTHLDLYATTTPHSQTCVLTGRDQQLGSLRQAADDMSMSPSAPQRTIRRVRSRAPWLTIADDLPQDAARVEDGSRLIVDENLPADRGRLAP